MLDDIYNPEVFQPTPEAKGEEGSNSEAERWEAAMADTPEYIGPFGLEETYQENRENREDQEDQNNWENQDDWENQEDRKEKEEQEDPEDQEDQEISKLVQRPSISTEITKNAEYSDAENLAGADQLVSFGFDTASHIFGLNTVIKSIIEIDERGADSDNPLGAIYERLAPDPESRIMLYREIQKERESNGNPKVVSDGPNSLKAGITDTGEIFDKTIYNSDGNQESIDAIQALRRLIDMLETSEKFADVRERAAAQGKTIVEYLVSDESNPTLTDFLERVGTEMTEEDVEEIVADLEEQVNPDVESTDRDTML